MAVFAFGASLVKVGDLGIHQLGYTLQAGRGRKQAGSSYYAGAYNFAGRSWMRPGQPLCDRPACAARGGWDSRSQRGYVRLHTRFPSDVGSAKERAI